MKIQINEVWNATGKSVELVTLKVSRFHAKEEVWNWILAHRPDLEMALTLNAHGFHVKEVA